MLDKQMGGHVFACFGIWTGSNVVEASDLQLSHIGIVLRTTDVEL